MAAQQNQPMRIAMLGLRGIPATWGGVERSVEELGARLAERGHEVTVYCRSNYQESKLATHRGMKSVTLPTIGTKHFDAITHSALSAIHSVPQRYDIINFHTIGPALVSPIPRYLSGSQVLLTVRGLDNQRVKWGSSAKRVLDLAEKMSGRIPHHVIAVSQALEEHYRTNHKSPVSYIPNGIAAPSQGLSPSLVKRFGVEAGNYMLSVGRLVPEKAPELMLQAFRRLPGDMKLVIAGGSSFTDGYVKEIEAFAARDERVIMAGYVYGDDLAALYEHAAAFVTPSLLEGLPRTLLEATSHGIPVVASDIAPHMEILGAQRAGHRIAKAGDVSSLASAMAAILADPESEKVGAKQTREDVLERYSWDTVVDQTEALYRSLLA